MVNIIIIVLLLFGFLMGLRRGFILQILHLTGFAVAFMVAVLYYDKLASRLVLWIPYPELSSDSLWAVFVQSSPLKQGFYNAIAFAIIFFATKIILQIIATMLDFVADLPILNSVNKLLGSVFGFVEVYLIVFVVLYILALAPVDFIQEQISDSSVARLIIEKTPFLSEKVQELWLSDVDRVMSTKQRMFKNI